MAEWIASPDPQTPTLVSRAHSDRQRANRAFAAEFGVSSLAIRHQIENHQLATIVP